MKNLFENGKAFADRYQFLEKLGEGGMGVVYKVRDIKLDKIVALKTLLPDVSESAKMRFQQEARAVAKLDHPNIIKVYDFGVSEESVPFLVMDFLDGTGVDEEIKKKKYFLVEEAIPLIRSMLLGLEHAHSHRILHRDLKPSNMVLCNWEGEQVLKLLDFGLAKLQEEQGQTKTGITIGSPGYIAPEQAEGKKVDAGADIYSVGCIIFEMLTGRTPFQSDNPLSLMLMHSQVEPPKISEVAPQEIPKNFEDIVSRCLKKEPQERFGSVSQILAALEHKSTPTEELDLEVLPVDRKKRASKALQSKLLPLTIGVFVTLAFASFLVPSESEQKEIEKKELKKQARIAEKKVEEYFVYSEEAAGKKSWTARPELTDAELIQYLKFNSGPFQLLRLVDANITGKGLEALSNSTIKSLDLTKCTQLKDSDLKHLSKIKDIQVLNTGNTKISGTGLALLKPLPLKALHMEFCKNIDDQALDIIVSQWPNLQKLDITGTGITANGALKVSQLTSLADLYISNKKLNSKNVDVFTKLPLALLSMDYSGLDYEQFQKLSKIRSLRLLSISGSGLTPKQFKDLKAKIPWSEIRDLSQKSDYVKKIDQYAEFLEP